MEGWEPATASRGSCGSCEYDHVFWQYSMALENFLFFGFIASCPNILLSRSVEI